MSGYNLTTGHVRRLETSGASVNRVGANWEGIKSGMKIVVATDGSAHSETAAETLVALGPPCGSEVLILSVIETPYYWVTPAVPPPYHTEWHRVQREIREEAERSANRAIEQTEQIIAKTGAKMDFDGTGGASIRRNHSHS